MLRWLLPLFAVFALLGRTVTSYAAAGFIGDVSCCCPPKAPCKCHDKDGKPKPNDTMKRCNGDAVKIAPAAIVAVTAPAPAIHTEPRVTIAPPPAFELTLDDVSREPEKPPF